MVEECGGTLQVVMSDSPGPWEQEVAGDCLLVMALPTAFSPSLSIDDSPK